MPAHISQYDILRHLFNTSFTKAATSLSFLLRSRVSVEDISLCVVGRGHVMDVINRQLGPAGVVLETALKGDYSGKTYLLFSEKTPSQADDPGITGTDFPLELLSEANHLLTAAAASELSSALRIDLYGDAPRLITNIAEVRSEFSAKPHDVLYFQVIVNYACEKQAIMPRSVWLVDNGFFRKIRRFAELGESRMSFLYPRTVN